MADPIIIIGTGLSGYTLGKEFRKYDQETPLLFVTADDGRSYSKPMLSTGFGKNKGADDLAMADAGAMAEQLNVEVAETQVAGAREHLVLPVGHTGLLMSQQVVRHMIRFVDTGSFS